MSTKTARRVYEAIAYRDGKWWTFEIPELSNPSPSGETIVAMGQARRVVDLDQIAREVAALWLDLDEDDVEVKVTLTPPGNVAALWAASNQREEEGRLAAREAAKLKREAVQALAEQGINQREMARILGISVQRINQLTHAS